MGDDPDMIDNPPSPGPDGETPRAESGFDLLPDSPPAADAAAAATQDPVPTSDAPTDAPISCWRIAGARAQGPGHIRTGTVCQDDFAYDVVPMPDGGEYLLLAVSDGAGTAPYSDRGADLACKHAISGVREWIERDGSTAGMDIDKARDLVEWCGKAIASIAEGEGLPARDFACTLLVAAIGPEDCAFLQVGDGVMVIRGAESEEEYKEVFWPERGVYANETVFVTEPTVGERVRFDRWDGRIADVALMSDGVQSLALNYAEHNVHAPFFAKTFGLLATEAPGWRTDLSALLSSTLASETFASRSDDDKALVIASRTEASRT